MGECFGCDLVSMACPRHMRHLEKWICSIWRVQVHPCTCSSAPVHPLPSSWSPSTLKAFIRMCRPPNITKEWTPKLDVPHWVPGPWKCGLSPWHFVSITSASWDVIGTSSEAAILDFHFRFGRTVFYPFPTGVWISKMLTWLLEFCFYHSYKPI